MAAQERSEAPAATAAEEAGLVRHASCCSSHRPALPVRVATGARAVMGGRQATAAPAATALRGLPTVAQAVPAVPPGRDQVSAAKAVRQADRMR